MFLTNSNLQPLRLADTIMEREPPPRIPIPKYQPPEKHVSEKGSNNMYDFSKLDFGQVSIVTSYLS